MSQPPPTRNVGHPTTVLAIVGSPRRQGNTETLVDAVLSGAAEAGAQVEKVCLRDIKIGPCLACDACQRTGACAQKDDMAALLLKMQESEIWVLGTPVYWWGPTAQFKAFVDRWHGAKQVRFRGRQVILVIPLDAGDAHYARHTVGMRTDALNYQGTRILATVLAPGVQGRGAVRSHAAVLARARQAGASF